MNPRGRKRRGGCCVRRLADELPWQAGIACRRWGEGGGAHLQMEEEGKTGQGEREKRSSQTRCVHGRGEGVALVVPGEIR